MRLELCRITLSDQTKAWVNSFISATPVHTTTYMALGLDTKSNRNYMLVSPQISLFSLCAIIMKLCKEET